MCRLLRAFTLFTSQLVTMVLSAQGKRRRGFHQAHT